MISLSRCSSSWVVLLISAVFFMPVAAFSQQKELTVEELEKYLEQQKAALEEVRLNREQTEAKALEVKQALAEQEARRVKLEQELEALCEEQEAINPGTYDDCKAAIAR